MLFLVGRRRNYGGGQLADAFFRVSKRSEPLIRDSIVNLISVQLYL